MERDLIEDINLAWAEYEYVRSTVMTKINKILEDYFGSSDHYLYVDMEDAVITIIANPDIKLSLLMEIQELLGTDAVISVSKKKNLKITFNEL